MYLLSQRPFFHVDTRRTLTEAVEIPKPNTQYNVHFRGSVIYFLLVSRNQPSNGPWKMSDFWVQAKEERNY